MRLLRAGAQHPSAPRNGTGCFLHSPPRSGRATFYTLVAPAACRADAYAPLHCCLGGRKLLYPSTAVLGSGGLARRAVLRRAAIRPAALVEWHSPRWPSQETAVIVAFQTPHPRRPSWTLKRQGKAVIAQEAARWMQRHSARRVPAPRHSTASSDAASADPLKCAARSAAGSVQAHQQQDAP